MFSRDPKHYRPTPRTIQQAFGPYHKFEIEKCRKHERLVITVGVIALGVLFGLLFGWRG